LGFSHVMFWFLLWMLEIASYLIWKRSSSILQYYLVEQKQGGGMGVHSILRQRLVHKWCTV
jgi:hypothetical protein